MNSTSLATLRTRGAIINKIKSTQHAHFEQTNEFEQHLLNELTPGTWVQIHWNDTPPTVELFLEWVQKHNRNYTGDRSMLTFEPEHGLNRHAVHTQIMRFGPAVAVPAPSELIENSDTGALPAKPCNPV